jgi:thioredoxin reductase (NADPH)
MEQGKLYDVIMIGSGPSALTAAIYTTREDIETVLIEKSAIGGLAAVTDMIDNYPGFPDGIAGMELAGLFEKQAERFGAKIEFGEVSKIVLEGENKILTIDGKEYKAKSVLISTGSDWKKIGVPGELEYYGRGVHYCATCDGAFYRDKKLVVIGGGNSAVQEALFLTRFASHIDLLVRSTLKASDILQHELQKYVDEGKITVHLNTETQEFLAADNKIYAVKAIESGVEQKFDCDGVFVFVGLKPNTDFLKDSEIELDDLGLVKTDLHLQTSVPGIFASGDVRSGATRQVASAVGEGAAVAISIREYLDERNRSSK